MGPYKKDMPGPVSASGLTYDSWFLNIVHHYSNKSLSLFQIPPPTNLTMGITGLLPMLKPACRPAKLQQFSDWSTFISNKQKFWKVYDQRMVTPTSSCQLIHTNFLISINQLFLPAGCIVAINVYCLLLASQVGLLMCRAARAGQVHGRVHQVRHEVRPVKHKTYPGLWWK